MATRQASFTNHTLRMVQPRATPYKLRDPETPGLFLLVAANGRKSWRLRQTRNGKTTEPTLGTFPDLAVENARSIAAGMRAEAGAITFREASDEWMAQRLHVGDKTERSIETRLRNHILPVLGDRPLTAIKPSDVHAIIVGLRVNLKADTASRCLWIIRQVFAHAAVRYDLNFNPADQVAQTRMPRPPKQHRKAPTMEQLGTLMCILENYPVRSTANAFRFLALTAVRYGEVRFADWAEFRDLDDPAKALWIIPAGRTKMRREHRQPLSPQAMATLKAQAGKSWPTRGLVFPGPEKDKPLSENGLLQLVSKRIGKNAFTVHGLRGCFSTHANDALKAPDVIEACLAHVDSNGVRKAYNHAAYVEPKRVLLNWWADEVDAATATRKARQAARISDLLG